MTGIPDNDATDTPTLGDIIRERRHQLGFTQKELAESTGIAPAVLNRIESGQTNSPKRDKLVRLARVLDLDLADLFGDSGLSGTGDLLPSFQPYLRAKYGDLPPEAQDRLSQYFVRVQKEYGGSGSGPRKHEDE
jgi:transcriptional regulator with XRE-family HTH domain